MADNKRKNGPGADRGSAPKQRKGGSGGRWKTTHQQNKLSGLADVGSIMEVGDQGLWVTYARGMKAKAIREFTDLCEEYGESMYGLKKPEEDDKPQNGGEAKDQEPEDIEAAMQRELSEAKKPSKPKVRKPFSIIPADVECLFFVKTMKPVDPVEFVRRICTDARNSTDVMQRKTKYINRLTPVSGMEKATDNGIERLAREVLGQYFTLVKGEDEGEGEATEEKAAEGEEKPKYAYAIRQNIRNHNTIKSGDLIKKVAGMIDPSHKVNLGNPDKVILIEIYQMFCGISVVDGAEWEGTKRYNMNELYRIAAERVAEAPEEKDEEKDEKTESKDEAGSKPEESATSA